MILAVVLCIAGMMFLLRGARLFVHGATTIALRFRIPHIFVGLTIVAFGTSAPELFVTLRAALQGAPALAVGNILGSNIFNLLVILGVAALSGTVLVKKASLRRDVPLLVGGTLLLTVLVSDWLFAGTEGNLLSVRDGLLLLGLFGVYLYALLWEKDHDGLRIIEHFRFRAGYHVTLVGPHRLWLAALECAGAIIALWLGGLAFVQGAIGLGAVFHLPDEAVGLTVAAIGTSLPELVTTLTALWKREADLAVGNILGSNLFNLLFILGSVAVTRPLTWTADFGIDLAWQFVALGMFIIVLFVGKKRGRVSRGEGAALVGTYAIYLISLLFRYAP